MRRKILQAKPPRPRSGRRGAESRSGDDLSGFARSLVGARGLRCPDYGIAMLLLHEFLVELILDTFFLKMSTPTNAEELPFGRRKTA